MGLIGGTPPPSPRKSLAQRVKERVFYESPLGMLEEGWWVYHDDGPNDGPHDSKEAALKAARVYEEEQVG